MGVLSVQGLQEGVGAGRAVNEPQPLCYWEAVETGKQGAVIWDKAGAGLRTSGWDPAHLPDQPGRQLAPVGGAVTSSVPRFELRDDGPGASRALGRRPPVLRTGPRLEGPSARCMCCCHHLTFLHHFLRRAPFSVCTVPCPYHWSLVFLLRMRISRPAPITSGHKFE